MALALGTRHPLPAGTVRYAASFGIRAGQGNRVW